MELKFECPTCGQHLSATSEQIGLTAACPNCNSSVTVPARKDDEQTVFLLPTKLPFLKSHRKKILEAKVTELVSLGPIDESIEAKLQDFAVALRLEKADATAVLTGRFTAEFEPIKRRTESSFVLTDSDLEEIETLKKKYNVNLTLKGNASLFRAIYLLESKHELPPPIQVDLLLDPNETCYYTIPTTWHQSRVQTRGYSGTSVSLPTGIKGVRFRFGGYTPIRTEQMTALAAGTLFVTSKRLLFSGDSKNTTIGLKKIVDGHVFSDCVKIEKNTGKPDLFSMNAAQARFVLSLVGVLKER
jgi:DNA-directed RNA polymerase subunit RPC12/RpoP